MKKLLLTVTALCAFVQPLNASVVNFCGPKPQGKCDIGDPSQLYVPGVGYGLESIKIFGFEPNFRTPPVIFDFREVQFSLAFTNGNLPEFEISAGGRIKKEKPKSAGVFQYSVISDQPLNEIFLSVDYAPVNSEVFAGLYDIRASGITLISGMPGIPPNIPDRNNAMATPEPSTWIMSLIGFGAFLLPRAFRRKAPRGTGLSLSHQ
jgi:hypothetical protein